MNLNQPDSKLMVIFDWNMTLLDDGPLIQHVLNAPIKLYKGKLVTLEDYYRHNMESINGSILPLYKSKIPVPFTKEVQDEIRKIYRSEYASRMNSVSLFPGAEDVLLWLKKKNITTGVVTGQSPDELFWPLIEKFSLQKFFCQDNNRKNCRIIQCEPNQKTSSIKKLIKSNSTIPKYCFYVGDTVTDVKQAKKAGVNSVLYINGYASYDLVKQMITASQPDYVIYNFFDLKQIIERLIT